MIAYKIFRNLHYPDYDDLYSIFINKNEIENEFIINYKVNKKNYAPDWLTKEGYYPLVFDTYENAEKFFIEFNLDKDEPTMQIWEVEIDKLINIDKPFLNIRYLRNFEIKEIDKEDYPYSYRSNIGFSEGSYFAEYVIPIKNINKR